MHTSYVIYAYFSQDWLNSKMSRALVLLVVGCTLTHAVPVGDTVNTASGAVQGKLDTNARVFRGIPFGSLKVEIQLYLRTVFLPS